MLSPRLARFLELAGLVVLLGTLGTNLWIGPSLQWYDAYVDAEARHEAVTQRLDVLWQYLGEQERQGLAAGDTLALDYAALDARWQAARQYTANSATSREASHDATDSVRTVGFVWYLIGALLFFLGRYAPRRTPD